MKLKVRSIYFEAGGKPIVIMNEEDAELFGLHALDRVRIKHKNKNLMVIVDISKKFVRQGEIVTNHEVNSILNLRGGEIVTLIHEPEPDSVFHIREKIAGIRLNTHKINSIVRDVVDRKLSDLEISAFITSLHIRGLSMDEIEYLSKAMVATGKKFIIPGKIVVDKHSVGGIPGDKTSMLVVPIAAAGGLTIPKTSSKAITSPAGTADRMEVLAPVDLRTEEILKVVKKTNGCLVWGGAIELAPADDAFIRAEYPLGIDPLLLPSIISKKKSVGAQYVVIDIPAGRGAKIKTVGKAHALAEDFIELGKRLGIHVSCAITYGGQPLGLSMGPALEAREALSTLSGVGPRDLLEKVTSVSGILFEMVSAKSGKKYALDLLKSGKANKKFREIIEAQGGNPRIRPSDIKIGDKHVDITSDIDGRVLWIKNAELSTIAREAGAPRDRGAGIQLVAKIGDKVRKGGKLFTIYSSNNLDLNEALKLAEEFQPVVVAKRLEDKMLLDRIPSKTPHRKIVILER